MLLMMSMALLMMKEVGIKEQKNIVSEWLHEVAHILMDDHSILFIREETRNYTGRERKSSLVRKERGSEHQRNKQCNIPCSFQHQNENNFSIRPMLVQTTVVLVYRSK